MKNSKKFTTYIEKNTPKFKKIYTGLTQPLEDTSKELKENIFQLINSENGEIEKTFFGKKHKKIYKEIKNYKKRTNNIGIIGYIDLGDSNTVKILAEHLLKGIPPHKITTDSNGNKVYQAVQRKQEILKIKKK